MGLHLSNLSAQRGDNGIKRRSEKFGEHRLTKRGEVKRQPVTTLIIKGSA